MKTTDKIMDHNQGRWGSTCILLSLIVGYFIQASKIAIGFAHNPGPLLPLLLGVGGWLVACSMLGEKPGAKGLNKTLEHELKHKYASELTGTPVTDLRAHTHAYKSGRADGSMYLGQINHAHVKSVADDTIIGLAPYFLMPKTFVLLAIRVLLGAYTPWPYDILLGGVAMYEASCSYNEWGLYQSDITDRGVAFSTSFVWLVNLVQLTFLLVVVHSGLTEAGRFLVGGILQLVKLVIYPVLQLGEIF